MRIALILLALPLLAQDPLTRWMNGIARQQLNAREAAVAKVRTVDEAQARQAWARAKVLELIGGLPDYNGPLNARITGTIDRPQYAIEKVIFESLPKYYVTANLYRPKQPGRHPAVLFAMGHWREGKAAAQWTAANLAMKGFVVLAFDPVGQGEREQAYDQRIRGPIAGDSTEQHFLNGAQSILAGESFARYRIWDAKRALDYLVSRPEVDSGRVGCTGCSGGGTVTTYISALDPRIKAAAPACYINTWRLLFTGPTGDSEQSIPMFLSAGLDLMDYIEMFAPKPWLIGSTVADFFPIEGARYAFDEAKRFYRVFSAEDRIAWAIGPGEHGTPLQVREAIYEWFIRWLADGKGSPREAPVDMALDTELLASESGQVGGREMWEVILEGYRKRATHGSREELLAELRKWVGTPDKPAVRVTAQNTETETLAIGAEPGFEISATFYKQGGSKPPVLVVNQEALAAAIAHRGAPVLNLVPRGATAPRREFSGDWLTATRAWLIGRNMAAMRAADILRGADVLATRTGASEIRAAARGVDSFWLLMAAALEPRIGRVWVDRAPYSLRAAMEMPLTRNLHAAVIPGFALRWDIADLDRNTIWSDPRDWMGALVPRLPGKMYRTFEEGDNRFVAELLK